MSSKLSVFHFSWIVPLLLGSIHQPTQASQLFSLGDHFTEAQNQGSSFPSYFRDMNGMTLFVATHQNLGDELWITDGTAKGTRVLVDINPGSSSSFPKELTRVGDWIYFTAFTHSFGTELWRTDGTEAGTQIVMDIRPGRDGSNPLDLTALGSELLFSARNVENGRELWKKPVDGPPEMIIDLKPGTLSSFPEDFVTVGSSYLAFAVDSSSEGKELGLTDGTPEGTQVYDIDSTGDSHAEPIGADSESLLYFEASTPEHGREIWILAPASGITRRISDVMPGSDSTVALDAVVRDSNLFISLLTPDGRRLFMSRTGSEVEELAPLNALGLTVLGPDILFTAGGDLWTITGAGPTARLLASPDIESVNVDNDLIYLVPFHNRVYFFGDGGLWSSEGIDGETTLEASTTLNPGTLQQSQNKLYTSLWDSFIGQEPWLFDGSDLRFLKDLNAGAGDSRPEEFTVVGDRIYFSADTDDAGRELLYWQGNEQEAQLAADLAPGGGSSTPSYLVAAGERLFCRAFTPASGQEIFMLEDPAEGATVIDVEPGNLSSEALPFAPMGSEVFFVWSDSEGLPQLWVTDSGEPTQLSFFVGDSNDGLDLFVSPAILDGNLFFAAEDDSTGKELWRSDGTSVELVDDLREGSASSDPTDLLAHNGRLYWSARSQGISRPLWRLESSTQELSSVANGGTALMGFGSSILATSYSEALGQELWLFDGADMDTVFLQDIWSGPGSGLTDPSPPFGAWIGDLALFPASNQATGQELWATDGTAQGTRQVRDFVPGPVSFAPREFVTLPNGDVVFTAYTPALGWELWRSDGTSTGTYPLEEIVEGPASSEPRYLTLFGDWVVFSAHTEDAGREPWAYRWTVSTLIFDDGFESGDLSEWASN